MLGVTEMIYAFLVGAVLGANHVEPAFAAPILVTLVALKGGSEILTKESWFTRAPSPYIGYVQKLKNLGSVPARPWISYFVQTMAFGTLIGAVAYGGAWYVL